MAKMKWYDWIAIILLIIGGINWGIAGFTGIIRSINGKIGTWNLVTGIFSGHVFVAYTIFILVGLAALFSIYSLIKLVRRK